MGFRVVFDYEKWVGLFPQFASVTKEQMEEFILPLVERFHLNDGTGPVGSKKQQVQLLNLMAAHVVQLLYGPSGSTPGGDGVVGRVSSASEGSVSVSAAMPDNPDSAWYMQTQWGAMYWQLTAPYRTARYVPGPRRNFNPWPRANIR